MAQRSVLVINAGSSSIKYALYKLAKNAAACIFKGSVDGIGTPKSSLTHTNAHDETQAQAAGTIRDHAAGLKRVCEFLQAPSDVYAVGHRVVHGGEHFHKPTCITDAVKEAIQRAAPLAPIHNLANLEAIRVAQELFHCPHVAVFDTAFHSTIPAAAYLYGLPWKLYEELGVRRYGFHGTSYQFILEQAAKHLGKPEEETNLIALHLGAGASMCAIRAGKSVDTTMGITPLEGLVMATRSGDVDPAIWSLLAAQKGMSLGEIDRLLNRESGLYGLCGDADVREVIQAATGGGSERHKLALQVFIHRVRKYLGAYLVHLEGEVDALVFTAGVGERSALVRSMVCSGLQRFGIAVDDARNSANCREIQATSSSIKLLVIPTDEQLCIAQQALQEVDKLEARPLQKGEQQ